MDLCLVPEVGIELEGENGVLPFLMKRVAEQGHAVVVVAEGAGDYPMPLIYNNLYTPYPLSHVDITLTVISPSP